MADNDVLRARKLTASSSSRVTLPLLRCSALCNSFENNGSSINLTEVWLESSNKTSSPSHKIHGRAQGEKLIPRLLDCSVSWWPRSPGRIPQHPQQASNGLCRISMLYQPGAVAHRKIRLIIRTKSRSHTRRPIKTTSLDAMVSCAASKSTSCRKEQ